MSQAPLSLWTIYSSPSDYPGKFVARRYELDKPTHDVIVADDLATLRSLMQHVHALHRIDRDAKDDGNIVETWI